MSTRLVLRAGMHTLQVGERPLLMGVVNASADSFSDGGRYRTLQQRVELAAEQLRGGADILDVGGESASTDRPAVAEADEIERVVPLIARLTGELGALVSIDTYKPAVARAAIAAGASIVNDVSGLRDPELARVCAQTGSALVLMHTHAAPKQRLQEPGLYADVMQDVLDFIGERIEVAMRAGVEREQLIVDPGPDFAKTPMQTIELLHALPRLHELERPVLMAISRKDFIGALTRRAPRERLAGTLAALAHGLEGGAQLFRVHDVAAAADFIAVRSALRGERVTDGELVLAEELRHDRTLG
ncbi:MAG TPA: dihydropteroate synthase [Solirubrobacteraceae bacterium]|nr:dihydropteroate synthase [Solirubrobacteraceae bacterium]